MQIYSIWEEGYWATGMEAPASATFLGTVKAENFQQACDKLCKGKPDYDPERRTVWGCRLFDNENDARKLSG